MSADLILPCWDFPPLDLPLEQAAWLQTESLGAQLCEGPALCAVPFLPPAQHVHSLRTRLPHICIYI